MWDLSQFHQDFDTFSFYVTLLLNLDKLHYLLNLCQWHHWLTFEKLLLENPHNSQKEHLTRVDFFEGIFLFETQEFIGCFSLIDEQCFPTFTNHLLDFIKDEWNAVLKSL